MSTLLLEAVEAKELPPRWAKQLDVKPDQQVEVYITTSTEADRKAEFSRITKKLSQQAQKAGLTEDKLMQLLNDD